MSKDNTDRATALVESLIPNIRPDYVGRISVSPDGRLMADACDCCGIGQLLVPDNFGFMDVVLLHRLQVRWARALAAPHEPTVRVHDGHVVSVRLGSFAGYDTARLGKGLLRTTDAHRRNLLQSHGGGWWSPVPDAMEFLADRVEVERVLWTAGDEVAGSNDEWVSVSQLREEHDEKINNTKNPDKREKMYVWADMYDNEEWGV